MSASWWQIFFLFVPILKQLIRHISRNESAPVGIVGCSSIYQRMLKESRPPVSCNRHKTSLWAVEAVEPAKLFPPSANGWKDTFRVLTWAYTHRWEIICRSPVFPRRVSSMSLVTVHRLKYLVVAIFQWGKWKVVCQCLGIPVVSDRGQYTYCFLAAPRILGHGLHDCGEVRDGTEADKNIKGH